MTWRTQEGERVLAGAEADLYRELMGYMTDAIEEEIENEDSNSQWSYGVRMFDRLEPLVRLDLLASVSWSLLRVTETCPSLTAINECVIGAAFRLLDQCVMMEIDSEIDGIDNESGVGTSTWRHGILAVFKEIGDVEDLPDVGCLDPSEWEILTETLSGRILWDEDFDDADLYLDQTPEKAYFLKNFMSIDAEYFRAVPPSPRESDLPRLRLVLRELYEARP